MDDGHRLITIAHHESKNCVHTVFFDIGSVHSRNLKTEAHRVPTWQKSGDITKKCGPTSYHSPHRSRLSPVGHAFIG